MQKRRASRERGSRDGMNLAHRGVFALTLAAAVSACGGGAGGIAVETWGEEYIEEGIPAAEFEDGWRVRFSKFVIALADIRVADRNGKEAGRAAEARVFDLSQPGPHPVVRFEDVDAQRWEEVGAEHAIAEAALSGHAALATADLERMNAERLSLLVAGTAETGTVAKSFEWTFRRATVFRSCRTDEDGLGLVVAGGETATLQLTVHGDHLFYDSLEGDAGLRFQALAEADADGDGAVTLEELAAVDLTTLPTELYGTGGAGSIRNLREYVEAQTLNLVHFQGEGHCEATPR